MKFFFLTFFFFISCKEVRNSSSEFKRPPIKAPSSNTTTPASPTSEIVTFEQLKNDLLLGKCLRCHAWVKSEDEVLKRVVPGEPNSSELFMQVDSGNMPIGGPVLSSDELDLVFNYIIDL